MKNRLMPCPLTKLKDGMHEGSIKEPPRSNNKRGEFNEQAYKGLPTLMNKLTFKNNNVISNNKCKLEGLTFEEEMAFIKYYPILKKCTSQPVIRSNGKVWDIFVVYTTRVSNYGLQETLEGAQRLNKVFPYWKTKE